MTRVNRETPVHEAVLQYLQAVLPADARNTLFHPPNGENRTARTGALLKRLGTRPGVADLVFYHQGRPYEIEIKPPKGYLSAAPKARMKTVNAAGGFYAVVRSKEDCKALLAHWGIETRDAKQ